MTPTQAGARLKDAPTGPQEAALAAAAGMAAMSDALASRVLTLAEANRELEAFSYTVSHDLRTPLTIIENYAYALRRSHSEELGADGLKALNGIHAAVQRMGLIIQNILYMSRVTRLPVRRERVDLAEMARSVLAELEEREPERRVRFTAPPHLWAAADPAIVRIALSNLMGNAWKFSAKQPDAAISFGRAPLKGGHAYFVRDNGVGFDMQQSGRLFQLFQRLHPNESFAGTGIGLATVARAVDRHGGTTWAESAPGAGATFYFTLGADEPAKAGAPDPATPAGGAA
jgi:light-regulated signal transduction histidine kinase (bacteriophytochrome)